jgi:putative protease
LIEPATPRSAGPLVPQLLAPAGTLKSMRYALAYGADAVYAGIPRYSLRVRNNEFDRANLAIGIAAAHAVGRRFYVTANLMSHGAKLRTFIDDIAPVVALGPDALIMADPGLMMLVRERWPDLPIHLSVQANTLNVAAVRFWQAQGITRVILSRELSLDEIAEIRVACPDIELEVFVHGALCIAYSGRCLLSGWLSHRDANQGACTNACRWAYRVEEEGPPGSRHPAADGNWLLEEPGRPGEPMSIEEDEHGTYILNARDLRAVAHVARLVEIGIDCLKIEGRTKSHYYVARTTQVYRQAIDDAVAGRPFDRSLSEVLEGLANRGYTDGFYQRHAAADLQNYDEGSSRALRRLFVGEIIGADATDGMVAVEVKNRFARGDELELMTPTGRLLFRLEQLTDADGRPIDVAPGAGWRVRLAIPGDVGADLGLLNRVLFPGDA